MRRLFKNLALILIGLIAGIAATIQLSATAQQNTALPLDELRNLSNVFAQIKREYVCLLYTSPSPRDRQKSRMPSSA